MSKYLKSLNTIFFITLGVYIFDKGRMWILGYNKPSNFQDEIFIFSIYFLYSFALGIANFWVVNHLSKRYSWKETPKKRAIYGVIGAIFISMITIVLLRLFTVLVIDQKDWLYFLEHESKFVYIYSLFITLVVVLILYVINFYKAITKKSIDEHQSIAKTEQAKFESLKSQLDPHFLFNSLNVLTSLIEENPEKAENFTTKLSRIYRYVLEQKEKTLVPLEEELDFAKAYMELLKMRFEEALTYKLPENVSNSDYKIAPLSLQLLLENAVKHNIISEESPLMIAIKEQNGNLYITNNYNKKKVLNSGAGLGLSNIKERYALITEKQIEIIKTEDNFKVILPLLTKKTTIMKTYNTKEEIKYNQAREKVEKMKEFYANLVSYLGVNTVLVVINYYTYWDHKWFIYPLLGWGVGLLFHYFDAFGYYPFLKKNWEEEKIKQLMKEEQEEMWE